MITPHQGGRTIRFFYDGSDEDFKKVLNDLGNTPLPRYIEREIQAFDRERYQTVYAKETGAVAAPTAGLHFSRELLKRLEIKGVEFAEVTLHVGLGTFRNIEVEDLSKHKMDAEYFNINQSAVDVVNRAIIRGGAAHLWRRHHNHADCGDRCFGRISPKSG